MRVTVRAVLLDSHDRIFLVQHHERNPADFGKWSTIGGGVEGADVDHLSCLKREIAEEFGESALTQMIFGSKLLVHRQSFRVDHFYLVHFRGDSLIPIASDEIFSHSWFSLDVVRTLDLFFGIESDLFALALTQKSTNDLLGLSQLNKQASPC